MPELPEVETVRLGIQSWVGKDLSLSSVNDKRVWFESTVPHSIFKKSKISEVSRRGKYLIIRFQENYQWLIHLRMTGKILRRESASIPAVLFAQESRPSLQIRSCWKIDQENWVFYDTRRFGTITALRGEDAFWRLKKIAPDPLLQEDEARKYFLARFRLNKKNIKSVLLDQTYVAGVGNIYADEALFSSGISPERPASKVKNPEELWTQIILKFHASLAQGGSSILNYVNANGEKGNFVNSLKVYGRDGLPCAKCGKPLVSILCAGRTTVYCRRCQK